MMIIAIINGDTDGCDGVNDSDDDDCSGDGS
jgi:hypothetical protein